MKIRNTDPVRTCLLKHAGHLLAMLVGAVATAPAAWAGTAAGVPGTNAPPAVGESPAPSPQMQVLVDPRVELFSLVFRLAGNPEYSQGQVASYNADMDNSIASSASRRSIETDCRSSTAIC